MPTVPVEGDQSLASSIFTGGPLGRGGDGQAEGGTRGFLELMLDQPGYQVGCHFVVANTVLGIHPLGREDV